MSPNPDPPPELGEREPLLPSTSRNEILVPPTPRESLQELWSRYYQQFRESQWRDRVRRVFIFLLIIIILYIIAVIIAVMNRGVSSKLLARHVCYLLCMLIQKVHYPPPLPSEGCINHAVWTPLDRHPGPPPYPHLRYTATSSFNFSRHDDLLYLKSTLRYNPHGTAGVVTFTTDSTLPSDAIRVEVIASYESRDSFERLKVCTVQEKGDSHGLGIL